MSEPDDIVIAALREAYGDDFYAMVVAVGRVLEREAMRIGVHESFPTLRAVEAGRRKARAEASDD